MARFSVANNTPISIPDYSGGQFGLATSQIFSYWTGSVVDVGLALHGFSHTFPDDLDLLLVAPDGVHNLLFLSDAGGAGDISGSYQFSDIGTALPDSGPFSAVNAPTDYGATENDAQFGTSTGGIVHAGPAGAGTFASAFAGAAAAGVWTLYATDDAAGDLGAISEWDLVVTTAETETTFNGTSTADVFYITPTSASSVAVSLVGQSSVIGEGLSLVNFVGGDNADSFVLAPGSIDFSIDGGGGIDAINMETGADYIFDLTYRTLSSIETVSMNNQAGSGTSGAHVNASQIAFGLISPFATIFGDYSAGSVAVFWVTLGGQTALDLGAMNLSGFTASSAGLDPDHVLVEGDDDAEYVNGSEAADFVNGEGGNDVLNGGKGEDRLVGGANNDWLFGDALLFPVEADMYTGGAGADWFAFQGGVSNAGDVILDYEAADTIFFDGLTSAPTFFASGADAYVGGVKIVGGASGNVTALTQESFGLLNAAFPTLSGLLSGVFGLQTLGAYAVHTFDADGGESFNVRSDYFDAANQLDYRWTYNDAGNAIFATYEDFDQATANPWATRTTYYSAYGVADYQWTFNDSGDPVHSVHTDWDQGGATPWTQMHTYFSAPGVADYRWTYNDAGQAHVSTFTDWDQASANTWNYRVNYYSATSVLDVQWTYNDAGQTHAQLFTDWDQASANAWNYRINYYTAPGVLDYQWTYNDAGNPIHSFNTDFDQASVATWNYRITYYSALNVADYQWTYNDAGNPVHSIMHDWDQTGAATWTTRTTYYSALNVADYQWTYHDAGQPWHSTYVDWDQANTQPWAYHVINYSAPGVVANDYYV